MLLANAGGDTYQSDVSMEEQAYFYRHRTALARSNFLVLVQALSRHGLIHGATTFFDDPVCGRGDDVRGLLANGIDASGWDPHYAPEAAKRAADVVNIGFVVNVIEKIDQRVEALRGAYSHVRGVLSVAAMLSSKAPLDGGDGLGISHRGTLSRNTLRRHSCVTSLSTPSTRARSRQVQGLFRLSGQGSRTEIPLHALSPSGTDRSRARLGSHEVKSSSRQRTDRTATIVETNRKLFEHLSLTYLELGRPPQKDEVSFELIARIEEQLGSLARALKLRKARLMPAPSLGRGMPGVRT